jgi:hypothetical protein
LAADSSFIEQLIEPDEITVSEKRNCDFLMKSLSSRLRLINKFEVREMCNKEIVIVLNKSWISWISCSLQKVAEFKKSFPKRLNLFVLAFNENLQR